MFLTLEGIFEGAELQMYSKNFDKTIYGEKFFLPIRILKEFRDFFTCEVLPHKNPRGCMMSKPYRITLDKHDVATGVALVRYDL